MSSLLDYQQYTQDSKDTLCIEAFQSLVATWNLADF